MKMSLFCHREGALATVEISLFSPGVRGWAQLKCSCHSSLFCEEVCL